MPVSEREPDRPAPLDYAPPPAGRLFLRLSVHPFYAVPGGIVLLIALAIVVMILPSSASTRFRPEFSNSRFDDLKAGMSIAEVQKEIGNPYAFMVNRSDGQADWHHFIFQSQSQVKRYFRPNGQLMLFFGKQGAKEHPYDLYIVHFRGDKLENKQVARIDK